MYPDRLGYHARRGHVCDRCGENGVNYKLNHCGNEYICDRCFFIFDVLRNWCRSHPLKSIIIFVDDFCYGYSEGRLLGPERGERERPPMSK